MIICHVENYVNHVWIQRVLEKREKITNANKNMDKCVNPKTEHATESQTRAHTHSRPFSFAFLFYFIRMIVCIL